MNYYLVVANEKLLCASNGHLLVLPEDDFLQFNIPVTLSHKITAEHNRSCFVIETVESDYADHQWLGLRSQLGVVDESQFQLAGRALQILRWHYDHQYCGRCGKPTQQHGRDLAKTCVSCELDYYPRLSPCIITLVTRGDYCLLAYHARSKQEVYSCLAGFIEAGESPEQTLVREVMEEVGIVVDNLRYQESQPWPFPGQLMLAYFADYSSGDIKIDGKEILAADWYRFDNLPKTPPLLTISGRLINTFVQQRITLHSRGCKE